MSDEECALELQRQFDLEAAEKAARTRFKCPLCLEVEDFDSSVELDCCHRLCRTCLRNYLEVKIREQQVSQEELCCPQPNCGQEITVPQVEGAMQGTALWDKFLQIRLKLWRPSGDGELLCDCPTPGCASFVVKAGLREVVCPQCNLSFCVACGYRHPDESCEVSARRRREKDVADKQFEELLLRERWKRCPHCEVAIERHEGCNFMTCRSSRCRGKTYFCYLCGKDLVCSEHFSHFPMGMYANVCRRVDLRSDQETTANPLAGFLPAREDVAQALSDVFGDALSWMRSRAP